MAIIKTELILAPHIDDTMLCLGGRLIQNKNSDVDIITVFNSAWNCGNVDIPINRINEINKNEDEQVFDDIKCSRDYWDFPEALERGYKSWCDPLDLKKDKIIINSLQERLDMLLSKNKYSTVYFPMAIEKHVDHYLIFIIMQRLLSRYFNHSTIKYFMYEDLPYAYYVDVLQWVDGLENIFVLKDHVIDVTKEINRKKTLLEIYKSQVTPKDIELITLYSQRILQEGYAERIWEIMRIKYLG